MTTLDITDAVAVVSTPDSHSIFSCAMHIALYIANFFFAMQYFVLAPQAPVSEPYQPASPDARREDLSKIPAGGSGIPASLLSKLSLVQPDDGTPKEAKSAGDHQPAKQTAEYAKSIVPKRPLIEELNT